MLVATQTAFFSNKNKLLKWLIKLEIWSFKESVIKAREGKIGKLHEIAHVELNVFVELSRQHKDNSTVAFETVISYI